MARTRQIRTVLVVDDDDFMLTAVNRRLRTDYVVLTATNSERAQEIARVDRPDVALVDVCLGTECGVELVRKLKTEHPDLLVVCFSSFLSSSTVVVAMKAGADDVVPKTESLPDVIGRLDEGTPRPMQDEVMSVDDVEWDHLQRVLRACGGSKQKAAIALGMFRSTLQRKIQKHERRLASVSGVKKSRSRKQSEE